ncbi:hypothetical protein C8P68_104463 [Mucilaginibacter yixingensis]|uniref:Uncharacterized protein n=1 Tax=Mucilaginibacter yixingensis TaxID=1295612 RepID=A0A2T5JAF3_9SPHI|nr:hypothetical protein [Mucilaginibacter yixingensis]PTQ96969.1 hypothetical protein C8P68_104463 [Mucilaginibacter yixingensis]
MKLVTATFLLLCLIIIVGCSSDPRPQTKIKKDTAVRVLNAAIDIADNKFAFKDLTSTKAFDLFMDDQDHSRAFTDHSKRHQLTPLTKAEKFALLGPFIKQELKLDPAYVRDEMNAWFVAKQDKIGDLQPIIIDLEGDDYGAVVMVLLDSNNKYVSGYNISGGEQPGPTEVGDSLEVYQWKNYAVINKNIITNYQLEKTDYTDTLKHVSLIDSVVYKIEIDNKGRFNKSKLSSKKYTVNDIK